MANSKTSGIDSSGVRGDVCNSDLTPSFTSVAFIAPTGFPSVKTSYNFSGKYRRMKISIRLSDKQELFADNIGF